MKLVMFTIYDAVAQAYLPPFFLPSVEMAKRTFANCANDSTHAFCVNHGDYFLYETGEFDDSTGIVTSYLPVQHGVASSFKVKEAAQ